MSERVTVEEAAELLGLAPQGVREHMKRGMLDIGIVVPALVQTGKKEKYRYLIFRDKLNAVLGKDEK